MRKIFLILAFAVFFTQNLSAQKQQQEVGLAAYNIALGGITAGIGAVINKPKQTPWHKAFLKGLWQGSIGGAIVYGAKKTAYLIPNNATASWGWTANMVFYAGNSIVENAALGEPFLQNWHFNYGIFRFDFSTNNKRPFKMRVLSSSIFSLVNVFASSWSGKIDWKLSLETGNIVFINKNNWVIGMDNNGHTMDPRGVALGKMILLGSGREDLNTILAHELTHTFQYDDYQLLSTWIKPLEKKIKSKFLQTVFSKYIYLDIPFFAPIYGLAGYHDLAHYYKNFYEYEAKFFSTHQFVER